ncbi:DUF6378 domain-containing protein [Pseudoroseicyclus sp. H15]
MTQPRTIILAEANRAVTVDRAATHGSAEQSFGQLAALWSALTGAAITPAQVALMLAQLKIVRAWNNPGHGDNWVDLAGYAGLGGEVAGAPVQRAPRQQGGPPEGLFMPSDE